MPSLKDEAFQAWLEVRMQLAAAQGYLTALQWVIKRIPMVGFFEKRLTRKASEVVERLAEMEKAETEAYEKLADKPEPMKLWVP